MKRYSSIEVQQSMLKICFFVCLSFFTTIVINILLPNFIFKTSPSPISSLSLLTSNHRFFPSDLISLQYHHELQTHFPGEELLSKNRTYTQNRSKQKNISIGNI